MTYQYSTRFVCMHKHNWMVLACNLWMHCNLIFFSWPYIVSVEMTIFIAANYIYCQMLHSSVQMIRYILAQAMQLFRMWMLLHTIISFLAVFKSLLPWTSSIAAIITYHDQLTYLHSCYIYFASSYLSNL